MNEPTKTQKEIIDIPGNLVVVASAGTGKTTVLTKKIEKEINEIKCHRTIAAITFTIKASKEIKDRQKVTKSCFIGTNNSFAVQEVVKPFIKDVYKELINITVTTNYNNRFTTYDEGVEIIKTCNEIGAYTNNRNNFLFELSLKILQQSFVAREYLKAKYVKFYIDEYQDVDKDMNDFFMYCKNELGIELFLVGDIKQSLYTFRGADRQVFQSLITSSEFKVKELHENFRSKITIQNYANMLNRETSKFYIESGEDKAVKLINIKNNDFSKLYTYIDSKKSCAILCGTNNFASDICAELNKTCEICFINMKNPSLFNQSNDNVWFYLCVCKIILVDTYTNYAFYYEIPDKYIDDKFSFKEFSKLYTDINSENYKDSSVQKLAKYLGVEYDENLIELVSEIIEDVTLHPVVIQLEKPNEYKHITSTIHFVKGLEFDQVIIFANDFRLNQQNNIDQHYVAVTRAKEKLFIVYNSENFNDKQYYNNLTSKLRTHDLKITDVCEIIEVN